MVELFPGLILENKSLILRRFFNIIHLFEHKIKDKTFKEWISLGVLFQDIWIGHALKKPGFGQTNTGKDSIFSSRKRSVKKSRALHRSTQFRLDQQIVYFDWSYDPG